MTLALLLNSPAFNFLQAVRFDADLFTKSACMQSSFFTVILYSFSQEFQFSFVSKSKKYLRNLSFIVFSQYFILQFPLPPAVFQKK